MSPFDTITGFTIVGILVILVLYILVVYKKGWLRRNPVESHFLCPNQKCRKIFTEPVWLTDLSITPPESYPACPHCSINLNIIPFFSAQKAPPIKSTKGAQPSFREFKKSIKSTPTTQKETVPERPSVAREVLDRTPSVGISKDSKKSVTLPESKPFVQTLEIEDEMPLKRFEQFKVQEDKKPAPHSRECPHFFGYVGSLPKNTPIPDKCLGCQYIVECLTKTEKVEA